MGRLVLHLLHIKIKFGCRQSPSQTGHETGRELAGWQTDGVWLGANRRVGSVGSDAKSMVIVMLMMSASSSQGVLLLSEASLQHGLIHCGRSKQVFVSTTQCGVPDHEVHIKKEVYKNTEHEIWSLTISAIDHSVEQSPGTAHPGIMHWLRSLRMSKSGAEGQSNTKREAAVILSGPGASSPSVTDELGVNPSAARQQQWGSHGVTGAD